jgi:hypothetical protein
MKFQKGILSDAEKDQIKTAIANQPKPEPKPVVLGDVEKNRLFETQEEFSGSSSHYLKVLGVVAILVLVVGGIVFYMMQPGTGEQVRAPRGAEDAVRDHFLTVQKRSATDIVFYKCEGFYWARVGVETRNDIANPIMKIDKYSARATQAGEELWNVTAQPLTSPELDIPCK